MGVELQIERKFDPATNRHYMNRVNTVLHCHHYAALHTRLADDAGELFDGLKLLEESARDSLFPILAGYIQRNGITDLSERVALIEKYWAFAGMGKLVVTDPSKDHGSAEMPFSHVDAGWIKKWGSREKAVNYITAGFLSAAFAAIYDLPVDSFQATETQSRVSGAEKSVFTVKLKQ
jgi:hypothetical protein